MRSSFGRVLNPALFLCVSLFLSGCVGEGVRGKVRGTVLEPPFEKPNFVFPAADGSMYDFRKETDGDLALLFFGFTNCPDVCPMHMQNLAEVVKKLSAADAQRVHIVFVTTDPERDTPERLKGWLGAIGANIVGLRPEEHEAIRVQSDLGIQPAMKLEPKPGHEGNYQVVHAAQVFAFTPDNRGHVAYPFGTRQADWDHDIPILLHGRWDDR